jgi:outer membrane lipopolysaccharide assembly protein LptE/RlpB
MKKPMTLPLNHRGIVAVTFLCLFLLMGCGYQMVGKETHIPPGLNSIAIPTFKNLTYEPGIEVQFTQGFLREFILDRRVKVVDRTEADSTLEGTVVSYDLYSVAYDRSGFVQEYQINVLMRLALKKRTGEVIWEENSVYETLWFRASSDALVNEANKTAALQRIGRLIAERIRNRFFYNF